MLRLLLQEKNISLYKLEKISGISHATLSDIYNEKINIDKCSISTFDKLSSSLNMKIDELYKILSYQKLQSYCLYNKEFDLFKSNLCHELRRLKMKKFLLKYLSNDDVINYNRDKEYEKALYIVSMIDYLCRINNLPKPTKFNEIRNKKLEKVCVSESLYLLLKYKIEKFSDIYKSSNPEFLEHNIMEGDIENVI